MSTSKLDRSGIFQALHVHGAQTRLTLSPESVKIRPNGVEFRADKPIAQWTEMLEDADAKLMRPRQLFTGPDERHYVPVERR